MTIKECYEATGGDYSEILDRLGKEDRIVKFAKKFFQTGDMESLEESIKASDAENSFVIAHTMKGNALNIGFEVLAKKLSDLVELLRTRTMLNPNLARNLFDAAKAEYEKEKEVFSKLEE